MINFMPVSQMGPSPQQMGQTAQNLGNAIMMGRTRNLMNPALAGDPMALQELARVNPKMAMQIQQQHQQQAQQRQQNQMAARKWMRENQKYSDDYLKETAETISRMDSEEAKKAYFDRRVKDLKTIVGPESTWLDDVTYESWREPLAAMVAPAGGGFEGTSMHAQAFNLISQAARDPAIKETPEYKLAKQYISRPQVIQTERGSMEIPGMNVDDIVNARKPIIEQDENVEGTVATIIKGTEKEKKYSGEQNKSLNFASRMISANENIDRLIDAGYEPAQVAETATGAIPGVGNLMVSPEYQQYEQAKENWVSANLRKESGAVIGDAEMAVEKRKYFPVIGDSQETIEQKAEARRIATQGMIEGSGRKEDDIYKIIEKSRKKDTPKGLKGKDKQAYEWAKANPDDPRAAQIMKKLGM